LPGQPIPLVYLLRHGTTVLNADGCFRGPMNPPLDKQGFTDAHTAEYYLSCIDFCAVFTSDRLRATTTARIVCDGREIKPIECEGLRAWNIGWFGGKKKSEYSDQLQRYVDNPDVPVPEGESLNEFKARVRPLFDEAVEITNNQGLPVLLVVHSSVIHESGDYYNGEHSSALVKPGGVSQIYIQDGFLHSAPIFKPDEERIKNRAEQVS
jgi:broad specificity phosphatase PhoE